MVRLPIATRRGLVHARRLVRRIVARRETVLFASPDRGVVEIPAERARMPWVAGRWIGGTLTNFQTTRATVARLAELESWERDGTMQRYSKPERAQLEREKRRLAERVGGLRAMDRLPKALVLVDPSRQRLAVAEARKIRAATIGLRETNEKVEVLVPGVTDAVARKAVEALADAVRKAWPPPETRPDRARPRRPPPDDDPGPAPVPARLRPRPTPGRTGARRRRE